MKSHIELWSLLLEELGERCSVSTAADLKTIRRRYEHEGDKVFTIALPAYCKDFERSLALGHIPDDGFVGWSRRSKFGESLTDQLLKHSPIPVGKPPKFLGGFLDRVFDASNGALFDAYPGLYTKGSDIDSVHAIRQLTLAFGKLKVLPDDEQIERAFERFVEVDRQVMEHVDFLDEQDETHSVILKELRSVLHHAFGDALSAVDKSIYDGDLYPKHGPGATADRKLGNQKYYQTEWTDRLEQLFPYGEYAVVNRSSASFVDQKVTWLSPEEERPVRVVAVPKTAKTPRIIAIEPVCMQYMQQAVSAKLVEMLEMRRLPKENRNNLASYFVGFTEQWPNQAMAQIGSEDGSLATLDLSDASDRVSAWLVFNLFRDYHWFTDAIVACRSMTASVPGHGVIPLSKYASMGSALTFPIEAMVFATIALWAISSKLEPERPFSYSKFNKLKDKVRVYGDDIIVPADYAVSVAEALESFGLKVNKDKSFWTGKFRESCGKEFYDGEDVSVVRYRQKTPTLQTRAPGAWVEQIQATVSTRNQFYMAGLWKTARALDEVLETNLKGWYPYVEESSPVLGRVSLVFGYDVAGYHPDTQSPLVKGYVPYSKLPRNEVDEEEALLKCLLKGNPFSEQYSRWMALAGLFPEVSDDRHLTHSGRPRAASIKLVKAPPY